MKPGQATPTLDGTGRCRHRFDDALLGGRRRRATPWSNTYTLNDLYGCGVTVPGTGVLLNDIMDDFTVAPGPGQQLGADPG